MHTLTGGPADAIVGNYLYDADGYRIVTRSHHGAPRVSIRDSAGQLVSEFARRQGTNSLTLERDYLYGAGQLLVERQADLTSPTLVAYAPLGVRIQPGFSSDTYLLDIRTSDGLITQRTGTVPADGKIALSESDVVVGEVNFIRVRAVDGETAAYSSPITLFIDPSVDAGTANQVRALAISRNGFNIEVLAELYQDNGRTVNLYFKGPEDTEPTVVTNLNFSPGPNLVKMVLDNQSLSAPCGQMTTTQDDGAGGETAFSAFVLHVTGQYSQMFSTNETCESDEAYPSYPFPIADAYHHRDHLGTLRVVTDPLGMQVRAQDYYPYGTELSPGGIETAGGSRMRFTGHERDEATELDYMMARYYGSAVSRFLSVDPSQAGVKSMTVGTWNAYSYVRNNPVSRIDPNGEIDIYIGGAMDDRTKLVESYKPKSTDGRLVQYFTHGQVREAIAFANASLNNGQPLNIIGHSWGADAAVQVAASVNGRVDTLIGVDPVGKSVVGIDRTTLDNVAKVVRVVADPSSMDRSDLVALVGKAIGGSVCPLKCQADTTIVVKANHGSFRTLMTTPGQSGQSAQSILNDSYKLSVEPTCGPGGCSPTSQGQ